MLEKMVTYFKIVENARSELDLVIGHVDKEIAVSCTDAAVAAHDFGACIV